MMTSHQKLGDMEQIMCLLQTIKDQIENQTHQNRGPAPVQSLGTPLALPSKKYGLTNLSDQAQAVLGDIYYFCDRAQAEQQSNLPKFMEQMESFCRRQDKRDESMQRVLHLITEINQGLRSKAGSSESSPFTLSGQQLLAMVKSPDRELSAEQSLELCMSIAQRRQSQLTFVKPTAYMSEINQWLNAKGSMLLCLTARSSAEDHMIDIIVQLAAVLKDSRNPTIWSFPVVSEHSNIQILLCDIVSQLLQFQPDFTIDTNSSISPTTLETPLRIDSWIKLLRAVLASMQKAFVILNLSGQQYSTGKVEDYRTRAIAVLAEAVQGASARGSVVKVLLYTNSITAACIPSTENSEKCISCTVDSVPTNITLARRSSAHARSLTRQSLLAPVLSVD